MPRSPEPRPPRPLAQLLAIVGKDLRVEWRSREILYTMTFFAVLIVVIFAFTLVERGRPVAPLAGGMLWIVIAFAGTLGTGRMFDREREGDTHRALLLSPVGRATIYLAKLLGVVIFIALTEAIVVPLLFLLFALEVTSLPLLLLLLALGTVGFASVGALFSATLMQARSRDVLLPILLFPIVTPLIVAGAKGTAALLVGGGEATAALAWIRLAAVFDLVFVSLSLWAFGPLTRGE